jgi:hypothetical protein
MLSFAACETDGVIAPSRGRAFGGASTRDRILCSTCDKQRGRGHPQARTTVARLSAIPSFFAMSAEFTSSVGGNQYCK